MKFIGHVFRGSLISKLVATPVKMIFDPSAPSSSRRQVAVAGLCRYVDAASDAVARECLKRCG